MENSNLTGILYFYLLNPETLLGSRVFFVSDTAPRQGSQCHLTFLTTVTGPRKATDPQPRPPESMPKMPIREFGKTKLSFLW